MQIEIDFDVFKALTALRLSEADTYNMVIRRLLSLPDEQSAPQVGGIGSRYAKLEMSGASPVRAHASAMGIGAALLSSGAIFNGVIFPEGTRFRATYKGTVHEASIQNGRWVGQDGVIRTSPSDAASAISGNNVNGWRFWFALRPGENDWVRLEHLR